MNIYAWSKQYRFTIKTRRPKFCIPLNILHENICNRILTNQGEILLMHIWIQTAKNTNNDKDDNETFEPSRPIE